MKLGPIILSAVVGIVAGLFGALVLCVLILTADACDPEWTLPTAAGGGVFLGIFGTGLLVWFNRRGAPRSIESVLTELGKSQETFNGLTIILGGPHVVVRWFDGARRWLETRGDTVASALEGVLAGSGTTPTGVHPFAHMVHSAHQPPLTPRSKGDSDATQVDALPDGQ